MTIAYLKNIVWTAFDIRCLLSEPGTKLSVLKCAEQTFFLFGLKVPLHISASQVCKMLTSRFYNNQCYEVYIYIYLYLNILFHIIHAQNYFYLNILNTCTKMCFSVSGVKIDCSALKFYSF